jgi:hypothetical protein
MLKYVFTQNKNSPLMYEHFCVFALSLAYVAYVSMYVAHNRYTSNASNTVDTVSEQRNVIQKNCLQEYVGIRSCRQRFQEGFRIWDPVHKADSSRSLLSQEPAISVS